jgi:hypothetical protein
LSKALPIAKLAKKHKIGFLGFRNIPVGIPQTLDEEALKDVIKLGIDGVIIGVKLGQKSEAVMRTRVCPVDSL